MAKPRRGRIVTSRQFFGRLRWFDRWPLLDTIEPYHRDLLTRALDTRRPDGTPLYNFVASGRAKKNWKTTDLVLAALYCLTIRGGDGYLLANDEEQATISAWPRSSWLSNRTLRPSSPSRLHREIGLQLRNKTPKRRVKASCATIGIGDAAERDLGDGLRPGCGGNWRIDAHVPTIPLREESDRN